MRDRDTMRWGIVVGSFGLAICGCEADDPIATTTMSTGTGTSTACTPFDATIVKQDDASCMASPDDYTPRDMGSANDTWPACISDDNAYHAFQESIGTNARVAAFEEIAELLGFGRGLAPGAQAFLDARVAYSVDEGLESRVARREDEHYAAAPSPCNMLSPAEQQTYPERCVGPVKIQPLLNQAFKDGGEGIDPALNAARIEAALLWFLYVSSHKEAISCAKTQADCDSSTGYYAGAQTRDEANGFSRYVRDRSPQAHERVWDGLLAVRCWRDLDNPLGEAENLMLRNRAVQQLDVALLRGLALIVRQRATVEGCDAAWTTARLLGAVLDREANVRDRNAAVVLRTELAKATRVEADADALTAALDALFPCP